MREKRTDFTERRVSKNGMLIKKKFFLFFEGNRTEHIYFNAVNSAREKIGINPLIELQPVERSFSERGLSNPKRIVDKIIAIIEEDKSDKKYHDILIDKVMDYFEDELFFEQNHISKDGTLKKLKQICERYSKEDICDCIEDLYGDIFEEYEFIDIDDFYKFIDIPSLSYEKGFDEICIIVDRDRKSFSEKQYDYVTKKCADNGFHLFVTNPCFEFWLLLHFDEVHSFDEKELLENYKVSGSKTYVEKKLSEVFRYNKTNYNAEELVKNIDKAIQNSSRFCIDIGELKNSVGSNICDLINRMRRSQ